MSRSVNPRIFFDMDGPLVDYDGYAERQGLKLDETAEIQGSFLWMDPVPMAFETIREILDQGFFEPFIATKPCKDNPASFTEKYLYILRHAPFMRERLILTMDKGLLGAEQDFLIDDRPHKANCAAFPGTLIRFPAGDHSFWSVLRGAFVFSSEDADRICSGSISPNEMARGRLQAFLGADEPGKEMELC